MYPKRWRKAVSTAMAINNDSDAAIIGTETGTATIVDNDDIAGYEHLFAHLQELAVNSDEALKALKRIADDYQRL